jgi:hypothetical protein
LSKISKYYILSADSASDLSVAVNMDIEDGHVPLGGVSVTIDSTDYFTFFQAMLTKKQGKREQQ